MSDDAKPDATPPPPSDDQPNTLIAPGEAILDNATQEEIARQLAMGTTYEAISEMTGISRVTIWRWKKKPEFVARVNAFRKLLWDEGDGACAKFYPPAIRRAAKILDSPDEDVALKAAAILTGLRLRVGPQPDAEPASTLPPSTANVIRGPREFVSEDLGVPLASIYRRVFWVFRTVDERADVRRVFICAGKGSGKGYIVSLVLARQIQRLLASSVDVLREVYKCGVAPRLGVINLSASGAEQAQLALFTDLNRWLAGPWFRQFKPTTASGSLVEWKLPDKVVCAVCGSSSSKSAEGVHFVAAGADEVCRLPEKETASVLSADALVSPVEATMITRSGSAYKLAVASWPEHRDDYLHREIDRSRATGVLEDLTRAFLGEPLTWEGGDVERARQEALTAAPFCEYPTDVFLTRDGTLVIHAPLWQMKPDADLGALRDMHARNPVDFARMVGARPKKQGEMAFIDADLLRQKANPDLRHPVETDGTLASWWKPDQSVLYYAHMDAGFREDAFALAVTYWKDGRPRLALALELKPPEGGEVEKRVVIDLLREMQRRGATFSKVTHDQYNGIALEQDVRALGIESDTLSVDRDKRAYLVWKYCSLDGTFDYYAYEPMFECARTLVDLGKKIDHFPKSRGGKKDVTDSVAGALWNVLVDMGEFAGIKLPSADATSEVPSGEEKR